MKILDAAFRPLAMISSHGNGIYLESAVDDAEVRQAIPEFDGMEQVFALVPHYDANGQAQWQRYDLPYQNTTQQHGLGPMRDYHIAALFNEKIDAKAIATLGVAFGAEVNGKTVWLQTPGDNYAPLVDKQYPY